MMPLSRVSKTPVVLVVDDQKSNLRILSDLLRGEVRVMLAKSGAQALAKAARQPPDLILLDVVMPRLDGLQLIRLFKQRAETRQVPVVFITGLDDVKREVECFELGASDYIVKPFNPPAVLARIRLHLELARQRRLLEELANLDPLTGVGNRRRLEDYLKREWPIAARRHAPFTIAMVDVDYFKRFNDAYGHAEGDNALIRVTRTLAANIRENDCLARTGGEEFVLVLPDTAEDIARAVLERCRMAVLDLHIPHAKGEPLPWLSVSIGTASCIAGLPYSVELLTRTADEALYEAKGGGRNRLVTRAPMPQAEQSDH